MQLTGENATMRDGAQGLAVARAMDLLIGHKIADGKTNAAALVAVQTVFDRGGINERDGTAINLDDRVRGKNFPAKFSCSPVQREQMTRRLDLIGAMLH